MMSEAVMHGAGAAGLVTPIRIDGVFDDPGIIRRLVQRNGPYPTMVSYLPASAVRGSQPAAGDGVPAHFRATWAAGGRPLVDGAEVILHNPGLLRAASQLFDAEVIPNTVAVNVTAPMPAGNIHVDVPSFRGADRDRYPMQLLQAMGDSGLFEEWRVAEAGAVWWSYQGPGGTYDYWPEGLDGPMRSEHPPVCQLRPGRRQQSHVPPDRRNRRSRCCSCGLFRHCPDLPPRRRRLDRQRQRQSSRPLRRPRHPYLHPLEGPGPPRP
jgi:hypothetical protein